MIGENDMKLCKKQGCGVCLNCSHMPSVEYGDICRYEAEDLLDLLMDLLKTKFSDEQMDIYRDYYGELKEEGDKMYDDLRC